MLSRLISQQPCEVDMIIFLLLDVETEAESLIVFKEMSKLLIRVLKAFQGLGLPVSPASCLADLVVSCLFTLTPQNSIHGSPPPGSSP